MVGAEREKRGRRWVRNELESFKEGGGEGLAGGFGEGG